MAPPGLLLLLLLAAPVAAERHQHVAQETLDLEYPHIEQHEVVALARTNHVAQESLELENPNIVQHEVVALVRHHVTQESQELEEPHIEQREAWQEEQDPPLPPDTVAVGATLPPPPAWPSVLVGFPPAWPVATAVTYHCRQPPRHPPLPPIPATGFGHLRRQAGALLALRPRLDACCAHHSPLPCARRAWTEVLDGFCAEEFGVKTRPFHCCRQRGAQRRRCFARGSAALALGATAPPAGLWAPVTSLPAPFPPGEPTAANMGNICRLRGLRLRLAGTPARGGPRRRMSQRLEREFGRCCRNDSLACAHEAWRKGLERFCREESAVKTRQHRCCQPRGGHARSRCFASAAPHPAYDRELHNVSLARPGPGLLRTLCGPTHLLTKRRPVPELLGAVTGACCPLPPEEQSACARQQLSQGVARLCETSPKGWRDPEGCCPRGDPERQRCFHATYLAQVTLGAAVAPPGPGEED